MHMCDTYVSSYKIIIQSSFNINYLTRQEVYILMKIYTYFALQNYNLKNNKDLLQRINININRPVKY